jgi:hypothetical protein
VSKQNFDISETMNENGNDENETGAEISKLEPELVLEDDEDNCESDLDISGNRILISYLEQRN